VNDVAGIDALLALEMTISSLVKYASHNNNMERREQVKDARQASWLGPGGQGYVPADAPLQWRRAALTQPASRSSRHRQVSLVSARPTVAGASKALTDVVKGAQAGRRSLFRFSRTQLAMLTKCRRKQRAGRALMR
jgi:hypothetical protein